MLISGGYVAFMLIIFIWLAFELWLNLRDRAKVNVTKDKNSGIYLFLLITVAIVICGISQYFDTPRIPAGQGLRLLIGMVIIFSGIALRFWAMWYLGRYFRTSLAVLDGQKVIKRGPYRLIRHPGYTGAMLVFLGFGFGLGSWPGLAAMLVLPFLGYFHRIKLEEQLMIACFKKEYLSFIGETKKLIPFIY